MLSAIVINENAAIVIGIITALSPTILAFMAYLKGVDNNQKLREIHMTFNSKMDAAMEILKKSAYAEGKLAGAAEVKTSGTNQNKRNNL